jgi:hypothetical protein
MPGQEHPKVVGDRTQLAVMAALYEMGYGLYVPFGENTRCDLVVERDGRLARLQIKTGRLRKGAVLFNVCSTYGHHPNPKILKRTYEDDVDYFAVHCRDTGRVYLIPIEDIPLKSYATLRVEPSRNNQFDRVRWARDYEIGTVAIGGLRARAGA